MALFNSGSVAGSGPTSQEGNAMSLKEYDVEINGQKTTLQLSDEDAKLQGLTGKDSAKAAEPANKSATPANKSASSSKRDEVVSKSMNGPKKGDA
jgi:hypothetical protein